ncbi:MAG: HAD superfamily hydrolase (TIGR01509 family) [Lentisphaeria bacterium]|jgi:HAD superfamily hydrolase (TIGR01509 family)
MIIHPKIDWHAIDTVLLDMDGTLLDLHFDNYFWFNHLPLRYAEAHGVSEKEARHFLSSEIKRFEGTLQWYCLDHWSELVKLDIPALKEEIRHKIKIRPHAEHFLQSLNRLGKKLVLITNSHPKGLELKLSVTNIDRWLDIVISSHEFSSPKEDQSFWHQLAQRESFDRQRTVFIDDTPRVLRSAQLFGISHLVCITSPDSEKPPHLPEEFMGIEHFNEIMPTV